MGPDVLRSSGSYGQLSLSLILFYWQWAKNRCEVAWISSGTEGSAVVKQ